jgi:hypothetical protein
MQKRKPVPLNPDLVIDAESAIDRMLHAASLSVERGSHNFPRIVKLVRDYACSLCPTYRNCRKEDWCMACSSGLNRPLFRGVTCLHCKLLTSDARLQNRQKLIRIGAITTDPGNQSQP